MCSVTPSMLRPFDPVIAHISDYPEYNLLDILSGKIEDVYEFYRSLHHQNGGAPVRGADNVVLVTRQQHIHDVLKHPDFALQPEIVPVGSGKDMVSEGVFDTLMFRSGVSHRQARQALLPLFSGERLAMLRAKLQAKAKGLSASLSAKPRYDVVADVAAPLVRQVMADLLGLDESAVRTLLDAGALSASLLAAAPMSPGQQREAVIAFEGLCRMIDVAMNTRYGSSDAGPNSDAVRHGAVADIAVLLLTGHDTLIRLPGLVASMAIDSPDFCSDVVADPTLHDAAVDELLRYDFPGQIIFRHAMSSASIGGCRIREGDMLALLVGAANRDPVVYENPDRLDIRRVRIRSLTFGVGPHACIGAALARDLVSSILSSFLVDWIGRSTARPVVRAHQHGLLRGHRSFIVERAC